MNDVMSYDTECELVLRVTGKGQSSHPRSSIPKLLANAGITERLWKVTFDETKHRSEAFAVATRNIRESQNARPWYTASCISLIVMVLLLPVFTITESDTSEVAGVLFILFLIGWFAAIRATQSAEETQNAHIRAWPKFIQEVRVRFQAYGIFVTGIEKHVRRHIFGTPVIGVVKFSSVDNAPNASSRAVQDKGDPDSYLPVANSATVEATTARISEPGSASTQSMMDDLEAMERLRDRGILTESEFQRTKTKLLRDHGVVDTGVPTTVARVIPLTDAYDDEGADPLIPLL